jgi:hypothetical protein
VCENPDSLIIQPLSRFFRTYPALSRFKITYLAMMLYLKGVMQPYPDIIERTRYPAVTVLTGENYLTIYRHPLMEPLVLVSIPTNRLSRGGGSGGTILIAESFEERERSRSSK